MSDITLTTNTPATPIPVAALLPRALFTTLLALLAIYFVGAEQGATSMFSGTRCMNSSTTHDICWVFPATEEADMIGKLLFKGMIAGILAGLVAFAFAHHFGEPQVDRAIGIEESLAAHSHQHSASADGGEEEVFSRQTQSGIGLMAGMVLFGAALGGGLALSWAFSYQRFGPSNPRLLALGPALVGFLVMSLMHGLKYPPNPPAVGNPETIGYRTELYFVMMLLSIGIVIAAAWLSHQLIPRLGRGNAMMWATLFAVALMLVVCALMPTVNEVPEHFPADLLWRFRISSFGTHTVLWSVIGVAFGALAERTPATGVQRPAFRRG